MSVSNQTITAVIDKGYNNNLRHDESVKLDFVFEI